MENEVLELDSKDQFGNHTCPALLQSQQLCASLSSRLSHSWHFGNWWAIPKARGSGGEVRSISGSSATSGLGCEGLEVWTSQKPTWPTKRESYQKIMLSLTSEMLHHPQWTTKLMLINGNSILPLENQHFHPSISSAHHQAVTETICSPGEACWGGSVPANAGPFSWPS